MNDITGWSRYRRSLNRGFSLLEVIIATAILAASGMMLMSMFSMGNRHTRRAEERAIGQMLCQSKLDELLANPEVLSAPATEVFANYPGWAWSAIVQPTSLEGFVQLTVGVARIPGEEVGAALTSETDPSDVTEVATSSTDQLSSAVMPDRPTFMLTRWMRWDGTPPDAASAEGASSSFLPISGAMSQ